MPASKIPEAQQLLNTYYLIGKLEPKLSTKQKILLVKKAFPECNIEIEKGKGFLTLRLNNELVLGEFEAFDTIVLTREKKK